jgi:hypothetical protein
LVGLLDERGVSQVTVPAFLRKGLPSESNPSPTEIDRIHPLNVYPSVCGIDRPIELVRFQDAPIVNPSYDTAAIWVESKITPAATVARRYRAQVMPEVTVVPKDIIDIHIHCLAREDVDPLPAPVENGSRVHHHVTIPGHIVRLVGEIDVDRPVRLDRGSESRREPMMAVVIIPFLIPLITSDRNGTPFGPWQIRIDIKAKTTEPILPAQVQITERKTAR